MKESAFAAASAIMAVSLGLAGAAEAATIRVVALTGQEAPGAGGAEFTVLIWDPLLNDAGQVVYRARISPAGPMDASDSSIFLGDTLVANVGDPVPGIGGAVFESLWDPMLNSAGETAFTGIFSGSGVTDADNRAIFNSGGPLVRTGDAAPGIGGAVITGLSLSRPGLNDAGELAFGAEIAGAGITEDNDVFLFAAGVPVAREGDLAPGAGGAVLTKCSSPG